MRLGMRNSMFVVAVVAVAYAAHKGDLAAMYIAIAGPALMVVLHAVEVKLNRLLDSVDIFVSPQEADRV
jgi:hypothetical protein